MIEIVYSWLFLVCNHLYIHKSLSILPSLVQEVYFSKKPQSAKVALRTGTIVIAN